MRRNQTGAGDVGPHASACAGAVKPDASSVRPGIAVAQAARWFALLALAVLIAACDDFPRDPSGTYERLRGGTMVVGYLHNPPWVMAGGRDPTGIEPELVRRLARSLDARIVWLEGGEEDVFDALALREIALVIGGLTRANPWSRRVAFTRPYVSTATVVAGPTLGLLDDLDGLLVAVPRGSPAARWVENEDGIPVLQEEAGTDVTLRVAEAHDLKAGEHVKMTLHTARRVIAVPPGENRWLIEVDRFFTARTLRVRQELGTR